MNKYIDALFGNFKDAYTILTDQTTVLDGNDTALILTEAGNLQLFLPENGEIGDRGLALVEIYNAMARDKIGTVNDKGEAIPENAPYQGFTQPFIDTMKLRAGEEPEPEAKPAKKDSFKKDPRYVSGGKEYLSGKSFTASVDDFWRAGFIDAMAAHLSELTADD